MAEELGVLLTICLMCFLLALWYLKVLTNPEFQEGGEK